jgi:Cytochrome P460
MLTTAKIALLLVTLLLSLATPPAETPASKFTPEYISDAQLKLPENYRDWVYLTTGFDMSYTASSNMPDHHVFDNAFVNPDAYKTFLKTGTWPDKTMLVLENRDAHGKGSINQHGNYQGDLIGLEIHIKDEARFPGKWAFFNFGKSNTGKLLPASADCYSCHAAHAAVDTTFVQFYPTLLPIAQAKSTLSPAYLKEVNSPAQK